MDATHAAKWIWIPCWNDSDAELPGKFVLFRKTIDLQDDPITPCIVKVSADTRYRLFVNGVSVAFGPCKSYTSRWYYETIDISQYLHAGTNIIAAKVLRFFPNQIGSSSLMRAPIPGFILWGNINEVLLVTDESWQCRIDESIRLQPRTEWNYILGPPFLSLDEGVDFSLATTDWQNAAADVSHWTSAVSAAPSVKMMPALNPWKLFERPIPALPEISKHFDNALKCSEGPSLQDWSELLHMQSSVTIASDQIVYVEFETTQLTTGFLEFEFTGGSSADMTILYAESYEKDLGKNKSPFPLPRSKGDRRDWRSGRLYGTEDHITLQRASSDRNSLTFYEPFWFRTFRFIRLSIATKSQPLTIKRIAYRETHYPLLITTRIALPSSYQKVWEISLNTLRNCMHETFEDCPFYEQNQFAMDGRLQMLFTYQLSGDDRLARKTIHEFYASRRDDGLLETNFPVSFRAINIPQFSLFWILMLHDHMTYYGDKKLIRRYINTVDGILDHFDSLINEDGLVGAFDPECWAFVDWVKEWQGSKGGIRNMAVPPVYKTTGVATYNSLIYSWTLQHAADLNTFIGRHDTASEYTTRSQALNEAVNEHCFNGTFFLDGPAKFTDDVSEHSQIFAVLSGAITGTAARDLMQRTLALTLPAAPSSTSTATTQPSTSMPRTSYAMKHYVFRALEKTGLYNDYFDRMLQTWRQMVDDNLTTCAEDDVGCRSDCHGWSAGPIYELVAVVYGIRPRAMSTLHGDRENEGGGGGGGTDAIKVDPRKELLSGLGHASIEYVVPKDRSTIRVSWGDASVREGEGAASTNIEVVHDNRACVNGV